VSRETCECGRAPKRRAWGNCTDLAGCRYCDDLDGRTPAQRDAISALRAAGVPLSTLEVARAVGRSADTAGKLLRGLRGNGVLVSATVDRDDTGPGATTEAVWMFARRG
jgi:hypothetical protein